MGESFLIWTCNKRKFMKIVSSTAAYKERLGSKLNSIWYIKIYVTRQYSEKRFSSYPTDDSYCTKWSFQILRDNGLNNACSINAKVVCNAKVLEDKDLHFSSGNNGSAILCERGLMVASYNLECVLRFPESDDIAGNVVEEQTFLSKLKCLADDFQGMLDKGHLSDVTLKCGADVLRAHKFVLCARSPVFEAMFASPMQESTEDTVTVNDIDSGVFRAAINFLYSGQIKITSVAMACDLLYVAEKYQVKELKEGCVAYLKTVLSQENAIKILEVSDLYDSQLKSRALNFVKENFDELKNMREWEEFKTKNASLALEVFSE